MSFFSGAVLHVLDAVFSQANRLDNNFGKLELRSFGKFSLLQAKISRILQIACCIIQSSGGYLMCPLITIRVFGLHVQFQTLHACICCACYRLLEVMQCFVNYWIH